MFLILETNVDQRPITISEIQEPFTEIRQKLHDLPWGVWAERVLCDRVARHWLDIHALRSSDREPHFGFMADNAGDIATVYDGIPIEIRDEIPISP